jgi:hypothetical protein
MARNPSAAQDRESPLIGVGSIVLVLVGVVERARQARIDHGEERPRPISHDLGRFAMIADRGREERRPAWVPRLDETETSMTGPNWSTARYPEHHRPATLTSVSSMYQRSPTRCRHGRAASTSRGVQRCTHPNPVT